MALSEKDVKLLWGRSASRCSFADCRIKLTQDKASSSDAFPLGEQAHIVAEEHDGSRGQSCLTDKERNSYFNHILLCPNHHTIIDKNPDDYPIEKLHMIKEEHELWVERTLSATTDLRRVAQDAVYTSLIDAAVEDCQFEMWEAWTSWALTQPPQWDKQAPNRIRHFRQKIMSAVWPGTLPELERALITLSIMMSQALNTFMEHSESEGDHFQGLKFYKIREWDNERYNKLFEEYELWLDRCATPIFEATKSANWFADLVRRDVNPLFFVEKGKFLVTHGPYEFLSYRTELLEYSDDERRTLPDSLTQRVETE